MRMVH